eukprot:UN32978
MHNVIYNNNNQRTPVGHNKREIRRRSDDKHDINGGNPVENTYEGNPPSHHSHKLNQMEDRFINQTNSADSGSSANLNTQHIVPVINNQIHEIQEAVPTGPGVTVISNDGNHVIQHHETQQGQQYHNNNHNIQQQSIINTTPPHTQITYNNTPQQPQQQFITTSDNSSQTYIIPQTVATQPVVTGTSLISQGSYITSNQQIQQPQHVQTIQQPTQQLQPTIIRQQPQTVGTNVFHQPQPRTIIQHTAPSAVGGGRSMFTTPQYTTLQTTPPQTIVQSGGSSINTPTLITRPISHQNSGGQIIHTTTNQQPIQYSASAVHVPSFFQREQQTLHSASPRLIQQPGPQQYSSQQYSSSVINQPSYLTTAPSQLIQRPGSIAGMPSMFQTTQPGRSVISERSYIIEKSSTTNYRSKP